jgi:hypothetical protein
LVAVFDWFAHPFEYTMSYDQSLPSSDSNIQEFFLSVPTDRWCTHASKHGRLDALQFARKHQLPWDEWTCAYAAGVGHLDVLQWAREHGCPWDRWTCIDAARMGHLHILKWAREHGCPCDHLTSSCAARNGYLDILEWLRANSCPLDTYLCDDACRGGHLNIIVWAIERGHSLGPWTWAYACERNHLHILLWILQHFPKYSMANECKSKMDKFILTKKIIQLETKCTFINNETVTRWIEVIDSVCDHLLYDDLSMLIKKFI